jgi:hypothetical protein
VSLSATGHATHFGRFTLAASDLVVFTSPTTVAIENGVGTEWHQDSVNIRSRSTCVRNN